MDDLLLTAGVPKRDRCQPFLLLLVFFFAFSNLSCAPKPPRSSEKVAPTEKTLTDQSLKTTNRRAFLSDSSASLDRPSGIRVARDQKKTVITIPASAETRVSPSYDHPLLKLDFTPSIPFVATPEKEQGTLLASIESVKESEKDQEISGLQVTVKEKVQFLVTRPAPNRIDLLLVRASDREQALSQPDQATGEKPRSTELKDVRFSQDEQKNQLITLASDRPVPYEILPSTGTSVKLLFPGMRIDSEFEKLYRLQAFETSVQSAALYNGPRGGVLLLKNRFRSPIHIERNDNSLTLLVTNQQGETDSPAPRANRAQLYAGEQAEAPAEAAAKTKNSDTRKSEASPFSREAAAPEYTGKPISLDLQDADVEHVLRLLATVGGYNLVLSQGVQGRISLKLDQVPWDQALDIVLEQLNLEKSLQGNVLRILTQKQYNQEQQQKLQRIQARQEAEKSREQLAPRKTRYIQVNYTTASQLEPQLQAFLSERGSLSSDPRTNQLIIHDTAETIQTVQNVVRQLDRPEQQVLIEARLVFVSDSFQRSLGIKWGGGVERTTGSHQFGLFGTTAAITASPQTQNSGFAVNLPNEGTTTLGLGGFISKLTGSDLYTLDAQLQLGESQNQVQTISSPRVVTLNNVRAEMTQGTRLATQAESESGGTTTEYVDATLKLSVLPQITPDKKIILDLDISDDSPSSGEDIETRSARTKLMVDNEETIVIGGVQQITEREDQGKVPGAGNIPFLGWLFKNKNIQNDKRELLIFIHPTILD
ncbi:MAG: type IV pilus secretin PilQ [Desulfohalobiaceae bacterium]|nr:type IV pilus secretin PilQ [Desulfohalobiaceae bacterium]